MITKLFFMLLCLTPLAGHTIDEEPMCLCKEAAALQKATDSYLHFINQISTGSLISKEDAAIISPNCKKILNGQLFTQNRDDFIKDLQSVYENQGAWKIYPADIIVAAASKSVVLRLFIQMEKCGIYTAIVILRYDANYLITEINEVLNQVRGSYDFKENG